MEGGEYLDGEEFQELGQLRREEFSDDRAEEDDGGHQRAHRFPVQIKHFLFLFFFFFLAFSSRVFGWVLGN